MSRNGLRPQPDMPDIPERRTGTGTGAADKEKQTTKNTLLL